MWCLVCLWSNQISGFLDQQYLRKESSDTCVWPFQFFSFSVYFLASFIRLNEGPFRFDLLFLLDIPSSRGEFSLCFHFVLKCLINCLLCRSVMLTCFKLWRFPHAFIRPGKVFWCTKVCAPHHRLRRRLCTL